MCSKVKFIGVAVLAIVVVLSFSAVASATETAHGGYNSSTNKCLQCHDVHTDNDGMDSDYVLLRWPTVVDTCGSCHNLYQGAASPDYTSPEGGNYGSYTFVASMFNGTPGTGSDRRAYKVDIAEQDSHPGHRMLTGGSEILGGSGEINALDIWSQGVPTLGEHFDGSYTEKFLRYADNKEDYPVKSANEFQATQGLYCASCHTPHAEFGQQVVAQVGFNPEGGIAHENKLLSSRPNHKAGVPIEVNDWTTEGYRFCLTCHDQRAPDHTKGWYNHPAEFCIICHADLRNADPQEGYDFPHSSKAPYLLAIEDADLDGPDGICVGCHAEGQLP